MSPDDLSESVTVRILRFDPMRDRKPHYQSYKVPKGEAQTVLGLLSYVYENLDHTLAFKQSCNQGECGDCTVVVNGIPLQICMTPVQGREITVEPLPFLPVVRDLVVDRRSYDRLFERTRSFLERFTEPADEPEFIDPKLSAPLHPSQHALGLCTECLACVAVCPPSQEGLQFFPGPMLFVEIAKHVLDPRDEGKKALIAVSEGIYNCTLCDKCREICLYNIEVPKMAIEKVRAAAVQQGCLLSPGHLEMAGRIKRTGRSIDQTTKPFLEEFATPVSVRPRRRSK